MNKLFLIFYLATETFEDRKPLQDAIGGFIIEMENTWDPEAFHHELKTLLPFETDFSPIPTAPRENQVFYKLLARVPKSHIGEDFDIYDFYDSLFVESDKGFILGRRAVWNQNPLKALDHFSNLCHCEDERVLFDENSKVGKEGQRRKL